VEFGLFIQPTSFAAVARTVASFPDDDGKSTGTGVALSNLLLRRWRQALGLFFWFFFVQETSIYIMLTLRITLRKVLEWLENWLVLHATTGSWVRIQPNCF